MIELSVIAVALLIVGLLRERQHALEMTAMIALADRLCQRLQAPEQAVAEHAMSTIGEHTPPAVPMDDDLAHWESKEQLAERLYQETVSRGDR